MKSYEMQRARKVLENQWNREDIAQCECEMLAEKHYQNKKNIEKEMDKLDEMILEALKKEYGWKTP